MKKNQFTFAGTTSLTANNNTTNSPFTNLNGYLGSSKDKPNPWNKQMFQYKSMGDDNQAANGPAPDIQILPPPEIDFTPSGCTPEVDLGAPQYDKSLAERRRNQFLTMKHSIKEKMELYTSSTKGKLDDLKEVLENPNKKYSVTEEISKSGYYWTVLHYASHYGHYDVLIYLIEYLDQHPDKYDIFNMQTTEGKTPLFCAVLSGDIKPVDKMRIIKLWFDTNCIDLSLRKQSGEDLLQLAKKNKLYEFIVEYCLRED